MSKKKKTSSPDERLSLLVLFKPKALKNYGCNKMLRHLLNQAENCDYEIEIAELKKLQMTKQQAREFYVEHKGKGFFNRLVAFMSSNNIVAIRIEYHVSDINFIQDFICKFRLYVIGATDPNNALPGTMRYCFGDKKEYAKGVPSNGVHCSDSREAAKRELVFFFPDGDYRCWHSSITNHYFEENLSSFFLFIDFYNTITIVQ